MPVNMPDLPNLSVPTALYFVRLSESGIDNRGEVAYNRKSQGLEHLKETGVLAEMTRRRRQTPRYLYIAGERKGSVLTIPIATTLPNFKDSERFRLRAIWPHCLAA